MQEVNQVVWYRNIFDHDSKFVIRIKVEIENASIEEQERLKNKYEAFCNELRER